ncbi:hypothetical protein F7Q99_28785 [Streptomyces kaniharaensis]|uniref:Uncharacterized protein n=1 Tax=Streptomyces kaniharaensis TaxID=212423 RepID=A0A6N7L1R1_9ACTN|nr:hypothetical protein [Streptomyces kaniharaensis]MQS16124.1 hypothetical protein [Streptomyces kaniharaensis]
MTSPQHDPERDEAMARSAIDAYLTNRTRYWERAAQQTKAAEAQAAHRAARDRLTRWKNDGVLDDWVASAVVEAAEQDAARIGRETAAAKTGPALHATAVRHTESIRRWLHAQGHRLPDNTPEKT